VIIGQNQLICCRVCGQADKPWIACYVALFIVSYKKVPLEGSSSYGKELPILPQVSVGS
jgi:hypothetical protein